MIAVDTNILVRIFTADNPEQTRRAKALLESDLLWVSNTVFLETAWVLSYYYDFDEPEICQAFGNLLGLTNVQTESSALDSVLDLCARGLQFADAFHLSCRPPGATFATFDEQLLKRALRAGVRDVKRP